MASDAEDLQVALEAEQGWQLSPNVTTDVITEVKNSLMFSIKWEDLLQSAPTAISCMGACFAASSSPKAVVQLHPPAGKSFEHLKYISAQANLVECGNLGRYAFIEAESGMGINDVIMCLGDPTSQKTLLKVQLNAIKNGANGCHKAAVRMEEKFNTWLLYACEMHSACVEQETITRDNLLNKDFFIEAEQASLQWQKQAVDAAEEGSNRLKEQVATATDAFKKASESFPSGLVETSPIIFRADLKCLLRWSLLGQQIVGDLANSLSLGLAHTIPALIHGVGRLGMVIAGQQSLKSLGNSSLGSESASGPQANANSGEGDCRRMGPKKAVDPAYSEVGRVMTYLAALKGIVTGDDGDVDWEKAKGDRTNANSSVKFLELMISKSKDDFQSVSTTAKPSRKLKRVLSVCFKVASEIRAEVDKSSDIRWSKPPKDSKQVKNWQTDFNTQYETANTLMAEARSLPGSSAKSIPVMASSASSKEASKVNFQSSVAQTMLETAKFRLLTTQETLVATQEKYAESISLLAEQQKRLGESQAKLKRLTDSNVTLTEIKSILVECIKLVINLKGQITNLVRFFNGMSQAIDLAVELHVNPFINHVEGVADPNGDYRIGKYTMEDLLRSGVYNAAVIVRSYFGVFGDIAKMWNQLSAESVMPGLRLCDELSVTTSDNDVDTMKRKVMELEKWSTEASAHVSKLASEKQAEVLQRMETRIANVKQITAKIEPLSPSIQKAIRDGANSVQETEQGEMEEEEERSYYNRFVIVDNEDL
ncbi:hypothetical protein AAE478_010072 [Parahypoxylon ruwenzoriense]